MNKNMNEITISSGKINVPVNITHNLLDHIVVEFIGIFFEINTGIKTCIKGKWYDGEVVDIQKNKKRNTALIKKW